MSPSTENNERLLNPFTFGSETDARFSLLIITALASVSAIGMFVTSRFRDQSSIVIPTEFYFTITSYNEYFAYFLSAVKVEGAFFLLQSALVVVFIGLSFWWFRRHPTRLRQRLNLRTVMPDEDQSFVAAINILTDHTGLLPPYPELVMPEHSNQTDAQAFGLNNNYVIRLGGALPILMRRDMSVFRAIILHELAHIANRDITRTYFLQALWTMYISLIALPFLVYFIFVGANTFGELVLNTIEGYNVDWLRFITIDIPLYFLYLVRISAIFALFLAVRNSVLRVRELYADWRAALWGAEDGLRNVFARQGNRKDIWWQNYLGLHPTPKRRLAILENPSILYDLSIDLPLFTGAMLGISVTQIYFFASRLYTILLSGEMIIILSLFKDQMISDSINIMSGIVWLLMYAVAILMSYGMFLIPLLIVSYIASQAVAGQLQSQAILNLIDHQPNGWSQILRLLFLAAVMALCIEIGFVLVPLSPIAPIEAFLTDKTNLSIILLILTKTVFWLTFFTLGLWLWLLFARFVFRRVLGSSIGRSAPRRLRQMLMVVLAVMLSALIILGLVGHQQIYSQFLAPELGVNTTFFLVVALLVVSVCLWLLIELRLRLSNRSCPACGRASQKRIVVGRGCEHCGADLAPWVYAD